MLDLPRNTLWEVPKTFILRNYTGLGAKDWVGALMLKVPIKTD